MNANKRFEVQNLHNSERVCKANNNYVTSHVRFAITNNAHASPNTRWRPQTYVINFVKRLDEIKRAHTCCKAWKSWNRGFRQCQSRPQAENTHVRCGRGCISDPNTSSRCLRRSAQCISKFKLNSEERLAVGLAPTYREGVLLYNPSSIKFNLLFYASHCRFLVLIDVDPYSINKHFNTSFHVSFESAGDSCLND